MQLPCFMCFLELPNRLLSCTGVVATIISIAPVLTVMFVLLQPVTRVLDRYPDVVCIQLVSEGMGARNQQQLADGLSIIDEHLDLAEVYDKVVPGAGNTRYRLSGFTTQYPGHHTAWVYDAESTNWVHVDDTVVLAKGNWQAVLQQCTAGWMRPTMLCYSKLTAADQSVPHHFVPRQPVQSPAQPQPGQRVDAQPLPHQLANAPLQPRQPVTATSSSNNTVSRPCGGAAAATSSTRVPQPACRPPAPIAVPLNMQHNTPGGNGGWVKAGKKKGKGKKGNK